MACYCGDIACDGSITINNSIWYEEIFTTHDTFHKKISFASFWWSFYNSFLYNHHHHKLQLQVYYKTDWQLKYSFSFLFVWLTFLMWNNFLCLVRCTQKVLPWLYASFDMTPRLWLWNVMNFYCCYGSKYFCLMIQTIFSAIDFFIVVFLYPFENLLLVIL